MSTGLGILAQYVGKSIDALEDVDDERKSAIAAADNVGKSINTLEDVDNWITDD